jgi:predicted nucleic acid-binding protein
MIVDTSVASHWFVDTEFTAAAVPYRNRSDLSAPEFLTLETANVLYKRSRRGEIEPHRCADSIDLLRAIITDWVPDDTLVRMAVNIAVERLHPVYDCLYLALALERREVLVTADRRLAAMARELSINVELIEPTF